MRKAGIALGTVMLSIFFFAGSAMAHDDDHKGKGHDKNKSHMEEGSGSSKMEKHSGGSEYRKGHKAEGSDAKKAGMGHDDDYDKHKSEKMGHQEEGSGGMKSGHDDRSGRH